MKFECPGCAQHLDGDPGYAGRSISCPACGRAFVVPQPGMAAAPVAAKVAVAPPTAPAQRTVFAPPSSAVKSSRTSKLAVASLALSLGTFLLGPFGFIPGVICGHMAKAHLRRNPALGGRGFATAGLAIGYCFVLLATTGLAIFLMITGRVARQIAQNVQVTPGGQTPRPGARSTGPTRDTTSAPDSGIGAEAGATLAAGARDYSMIDMQDPVIPSQPASGPINGTMFYVRRARIDQADLVLIGDTAKDLPEIRLHPESGAQTRFQFNIAPLVVNAARFSMATQLQPNGTLGKSCTVTLRTADGNTDLTGDAGIRLVFQAPQNGLCKTALHLGFGPSKKEYLVGEFMTELPPELAARVKEIKPGFKLPDLGRNRSKQ